MEGLYIPMPVCERTGVVSPAQSAFDLRVQSLQLLFTELRYRSYLRSILPVSSHDTGFCCLDFGLLENNLSWEPGTETGISREWKTSKAFDDTPDGNPASSCELRAGSSQDEPNVLNENHEDSGSARSEAGEGYDEVGPVGKLDAAPSHDPTNQLLDNEFNLATQLLLFHHTDGVANSSNADGNNGNNGINDDDGPTLDCNGPDELEDDGAFDVIATGDDEDAQPPKRWRLPAVSCRYPGLTTTISKIEENRIDQDQSTIAAAAAIQQSDLRSSHNCHREGIAESDSDNSGSPINGKPAETGSSVTVALQSTDVGDPQHSDLREIRGILGTGIANGVVYYWVDWEPT
ncbi:MAG: hypothetical protein M1829_001149 [Trizodia sp. TS-e1964]|nr:MAG: hypothetical protein M1829_001149 [Trizodia sp. TS-e1964]